jgi:hypothetical protein
VSWSFYEQVFRGFAWWNQLEWALLGIGVLGLSQARRDTAIARRVCWAALTAYAGLSILARAPVEVWRMVPQPFRYIQFPERLLGIGGLFLAATLAAAFSLVKGLVARVAVAGIGMLIGLYALSLGRQVLPRSGETHEQVLARMQTTYPDRGLTVAGEYLPSGIEPESLARLIQQTRRQIGRGPLRAWEKTDGVYRATVNAATAQEVRLPLVAYRFHRAVSSTTPVETSARSGQLTVRVEPGTHTIDVKRRWPTISKIGLLLSLTSLLAWTLMAARRSKSSIHSDPDISSVAYAK